MTKSIKTLGKTHKLCANTLHCAAKKCQQCCPGFQFDITRSRRERKIFQDTLSTNKTLIRFSDCVGQLEPEVNTHANCQSVIKFYVIARVCAIVTSVEDIVFVVEYII